MPCVFCEQDGPLTAEHVFPKWLQSWLAHEEGETGTHVRTIIRGGTEIEEKSRPGKAATLTVKSVCAACNNGWMSGLETEAQPFIETMLRGNGRSYYAGGRTTIAAWLVKTALVVGSKFPPPLRRDFYDDFCKRKLPSDKTRVWLAATPERYMHSSDFRPIKIQEEGAAMPEEPNAYSAVISVGHFAGFVVSWLDGVPVMTEVDRFADALVPIWRLSDEPATWPPRLRLDIAGLDALAETIVSTEYVRSGTAAPNV